MVAQTEGFSFWERSSCKDSRRGTKLVRDRGALGGFARSRQAPVHGFQVLLQGFLDAVAEINKLKSHANAWVAGANHRGAVNLLRIKPERQVHHRAQRKGQQSFYVTPPTANVGGVGVQMGAARVLESNF